MPNPLRKVAKGAARAGANLLRRTAAAAGLHVLPVHFYSGVPDVRGLERDRRWRRPSEMPGIDAPVAAQAAWVRSVCEPFKAEVAQNANYAAGAAAGFGPGFGEVEAAVYHCVIRALRPPRIVEVGAGVSTYCALKAVERNAADGAPAEVTCVEPYPRAPLLRLGVPLLQKQAQDIDPAELAAMVPPGGVFFIDSSHAVTPGSDVNHLMLEVIPRLAPGVYVHVHDINFPYDHAPRVLANPIFHWAEVSLVRALLIGNAHLEVMAALSSVHYAMPETFRGLFPWYEPAPTSDGMPTGPGHLPSSLWLRTR